MAIKLQGLKYWLLGSFLMLAVFAQGQNLVGNPYFEIYNISNCTNNMPYTNGWMESTFPADFPFLNTCFCLPTAPLGCVGMHGVPLPKFKDGMVMLVLENTVRTRTYPGTYLQAPLVANQVYMIEFYYRAWVRSNYFTNRLGVVFSQDTAIINYLNYQNYSPAAGINTPLTDTTQWTLFKQSYVAAGGETVLTIGNFWSEAQTTLIPNPPNVSQPNGYTNGGFYPSVFIDGVFVFKATDTLYTATLPNDTLLCPNEQLVLQPILNGFKLEDTTTTYLWSTGSTDSTITVTQPGTYWVQTTINSRFVAGDTLIVDYFPANYQLNLPDTVTFCEGEQAIIQASTLPTQYAVLTAYLWNTGETLTGIKTGFAGLYWLNAQTPCYPLADSTWAVLDFCDSYLWVPNAFTPDGDGTNDFFTFKGAPEPVALSIFDRWGQRVFYSQNFDQENSGWDGTFKGQELPAGAYTYLIEYLYINPDANQTDPKGSERQVRGVVNLLR